jgi:hypothetical protein
MPEHERWQNATMHTSRLGWNRSRKIKACNQNKGALHCRVESLFADVAGLVDLLNSRRPADLPPLQNNVGWEQKGPLVDEPSPYVAAKSDGNISAEVPHKMSRHYDKFKACGRRCFDLARAYYSGDFEILRYPQVVADMK